MRKVLYISGTYYPAAGGAEISMHTFLKEAAKRNNEVLVATNLEKQKFNSKSINYEGVKVVGVNHNVRKEQLTNIIDSFKPDKIITQLMWSDIALELANKKGIESILRFCKIPAYLDISKHSDFSPTKIIVVSDYVKNYVSKQWDRESIIVQPPIQLEKVIAKDNEFKQYITMFNPNLKKGGNIFKDIALKLPAHNFAIVSGWDILKKGNVIDTKLVRRLCESLRIQYTGQKLDDEDFSTLKNVKRFPYTNKVDQIYAQTRILCVPSQWEEAFGRVSIEAMANSIPVMGSNVGGLSKIVNGGGILISDFNNPDDWVKELKKLDDPKEYEKIAKKGKLYVKHSYNYNSICNDFLNMLEEK